MSRDFRELPWRSSENSSSLMVPSEESHVDKPILRPGVPMGRDQPLVRYLPADANQRTLPIAESWKSTYG